MSRSATIRRSIHQLDFRGAPVVMRRSLDAYMYKSPYKWVRGVPNVFLKITHQQWGKRWCCLRLISASWYKCLVTPKPMEFNRSRSHPKAKCKILHGTEPQLNYSVSSSESATTCARSSSEPERVLSGCLETGVGLCLSVFFVIGGGVS